MAKEVAKREETLPAAPDFSGYEGQGFENVTARDLAVPFLMICQSLSPERKKGHAKEIKGIEEGMIFDSVSREIVGGVGDSVQFVPTTYRKQWVEWKPRENGGGFVMNHPSAECLDECVRDDKGRFVTKNGNHIMETAYFTGLYRKGQGEWKPVILSAQSTNLKFARTWLSQMSALKTKGANNTRITPPMWGSIWNISSKLMTKGDNSWYGWCAEHAGWIPSDLVTAARENKEQMEEMNISAPARDGEDNNEAF
jgi:hypothetical protein